METSPIPLAAPTFSSAEAEAVAQVLASGWVTQGPRVAEFEDAFARYTGARHACAVSNCTAALHLALHSLGVRPGDVVLAPSMSFIATANAIRHCGAEPVFVDVDRGSVNISPAQLDAALKSDFVFRRGSLWYRFTDRLLKSPSPLRHAAGPTGRLAALLVVHQIGFPCNMASIMTLARSHGIPVVEDAACAIGSEISLDDGRNWQRIGRPVGDVACFSFHPRKVITTGDGGMLTTNRPELDRMFRQLRQHGMAIASADRHQSRGIAGEVFETTGFNYRLTDLQAAVGLVQLEKLPQIVKQRRELALLYGRELKRAPGVSTPKEPAFTWSNYQSYQVQLERPELQASVMEALRQRGITTRRGIMCAHLEPPYRAAWPTGCLPVSEATAASGVMLPLFPGMTAEQVQQVVEGLSSAQERKCVAA